MGVEGGGFATQLPVQPQQQQPQPQPRPQLLRPNISGLRRPGSWVARSVAGRPGQHGLGPTPQAPPLPSATQQPQYRPLRHDADVSDVLGLCAPQGAHGGGQQQAASIPQSRRPGACQVAGAATPGATAERQVERPALQQVSNLARQVPSQSQQQSCTTSSRADPAGTPSQQEQRHPAVWSSDEQFRGSPAPLTGTKRKGGGGGWGKKAAAKPLAPPSQRISRFFPPASGP